MLGRYIAVPGGRYGLGYVIKESGHTGLGETTSGGWGSTVSQAFGMWFGLQSQQAANEAEKQRLEAQQAIAEAQARAAAARAAGSGKLSLTPFMLLAAGGVLLLGGAMVMKKKKKGRR